MLTLKRSLPMIADLSRQLADSKQVHDDLSTILSELSAACTSGASGWLNTADLQKIVDSILNSLELLPPTWPVNGAVADAMLALQSAIGEEDNDIFQRMIVETYGSLCLAIAYTKNG